MGKGERETIASQIWETIDLFNEPVRLTMRGKRVLSTNLGGILTICLVCFILYQAISQFVGMINREDPMIVEMSEIDESTTKMRLSHENNFFIAYTIHRNLSFVDFNVDAPFRYKSTFVRKTQLEDGSRIKEEYPVVWGPCKESDFPPDIFGDQFTTLSFSYAHCFVGVNFTSSVDGSCPEEYASYPSCISTDFTIQGAYGESLEEYIQSTLVVCGPNDSDLPVSMACQEDVIASFDNTHYETDLYIANNVIDRMNYKFPNNTFIDNIYWPLAPLVYKVSNILIDRVTMQNFNDYLSYTSYENQTFYSTDMAHIKEMITWRTEAESTILQWNLRKSIQNKVIIRTYPKIQEFLTDLGGFSKALMFISAFIAIGYLRYSYKMTLANELYDFEIPDKPSQKSLLEKSSSKSQTYSPMIFDFTQSKITDYDAVLSPKATLNQKSILLSPKSPNELSNKTVINYFESEKSRKKLKVNEISYFRSLIEPIFCWKRKRDHDKYASKGLDFVANDIDISNLIKKLGEIEKLKVLLLNKNQRDCLELWGKSVISLDNQNATHRDSLFVSQISQPIQTAEETQDKAAISSSEFSPETFNSLPKYGKLYIAYKALKYSKDSDIQTQLYNKKLLKMINPSLVNVFRRAEQILANDQQFEEAMRQILDGQTMVLFNHLITQNNSLV